MRRLSLSDRMILGDGRSEEHTSELQSRSDLVCRLLLEKKKHKETPATRQEKISCASGIAVGTSLRLPTQSSRTRSTDPPCSRTRNPGRGSSFPRAHANQ